MLELGVANPSRDILSAGTDAEFKHLPSWKDLTLTTEPGKSSTLSFSYPRHGVRGHMITPGARIKVRFPMAHTGGGGVFSKDAFKVDPPNMTFELDEESFPQETANNQTIRVAAKSVMENFTSLLLAPAVGSTYTDEDIFNFKNLSVGGLAKQALSVALSRSPDTHIHFTFDHQYDSAGVRWGNPIDATFKPGQTLKDVFEWLGSLGFGYPMMGYHRKWIPGQTSENLTADLALDRSSTTYSLHLYAEPLNGFGYRAYVLNERHEATVTAQREFKNIVNQVFVTGNDNICTWVSRQDSIEKYGVREGNWGVSNAALPETLKAAGERYLDVYAYPRVSQTLEIEFPPDGAALFWFPKFIFGKSLEEGHAHHIKVLSLSVNSANQIGQITLTLDNYFDRRSAMLEQRLARLGLSK